TASPSTEGGGGVRGPLDADRCGLRSPFRARVARAKSVRQVRRNGTQLRRRTRRPIGSTGESVRCSVGLRSQGCASLLVPLAKGLAPTRRIWFKAKAAKAGGSRVTYACRERGAAWGRLSVLVPGPGGAAVRARARLQSLDDVVRAGAERRCWRASRTG